MRTSADAGWTSSASSCSSSPFVLVVGFALRRPAQPEQALIRVLWRYGGDALAGICPPPTGRLVPCSRHYAR
jgi:hypothetical protein